MFVHIYSENVNVPNSLMNLFQLKYVALMGPIPNKSLHESKKMLHLPLGRQYIATV